MDFTDEQLQRLDEITNAAYHFLTVIAETDDIPYDAEAIWNLIYEAADRLNNNYCRRVKIPTHVTTPDGKEYITDWYGDENE